MKKKTKLDLWVYLGLPLLFAFGCTIPVQSAFSTGFAPKVINAQLPSPGEVYDPNIPNMGGYTVEGLYVSAPVKTVVKSASIDGTACYFPSELIYSELWRCMQTSPSLIYGITAMDHVNVVQVRLADWRLLTVNVSGDADKSALGQRAIANNIRFDSQASFDFWEWFANNWYIIVLTGMGGVVLYWKRDKLKGTKANAFTNSKAKDYSKLTEGQKKLTFDDIRGCDEAVSRGKLFVDMHRNSHIYKAHKAPFPRGILLVGGPGVGKTLFVRALSDVLDGNVFSTAGSDFVEMFVGVGASRTRDLFDKAKERAKLSDKPVIIFIDEIDAVAGKRGTAKSNDERENTLNALLVEMDGLLTLGNIVVIGATNRPDMLDPAILRRLASRIVIDKPDLKGRADILELYTRELALDLDVSIALMAKRTWDFSGDQLKKACDEAATYAAKRCAAFRELNQISADVPVQPFPITMQDFDRAFDFIQYGDELPSRQSNQAFETKNQTSVHEACHGVVAHRFAKFGWSDPVVKATIMRRSQTLGFIMTMPEGERLNWDHRQAIARIIMLMAGRAGQEVLLDTRDSGASMDFNMATGMAREMVMNWGMSDAIGPISVGARSDGNSIQTGLNLMNRVDAEWVRLCTDCYKIAKDFVESEVDAIRAITDLLNSQETILEQEWNYTMENYPPVFDVAGMPALARLGAFKKGLLR